MEINITTSTTTTPASRPPYATLTDHDRKLVRLAEELDFDMGRLAAVLMMNQIIRWATSAPLKRHHCRPAIYELVRRHDWQFWTLDRAYQAVTDLIRLDGATGHVENGDLSVTVLEIGEKLLFRGYVPPNPDFAQ